MALSKLGLSLVTAPNFSLVLDHPRTNDLHSIKKIGIVFAEFQKCGIPCALHPNSRSPQDFARWGEFVSLRPEVSWLSYEFITGSGSASRRQFHLNGLAAVAARAGRPLNIVIRGKPEVVPFLSEHFAKVLYIESTAFMKTMMRQRAVRAGNRGLEWSFVPTEQGEPLDQLFQHNVEERTVFVREQFCSRGKREAA